MEFAMALDTRFLDAIAGAAWPKAADQPLILTFFFDIGTGGAWTLDEESAFWNAAHAWSSVVNIHFLQVDNAGAADLILRKVTNAELDALASFDTPDEPTH